MNDRTVHVRQLSSDEVTTLEHHLSTEWGIGAGHWYPLEDTFRRDVLALEAGPFLAAGGPAALRAILNERGVDRCVRVAEFEGQPVVEVSAANVGAPYDGSEQYWTAAPFDWIVYVSHEESFTIGGAALIEAFKAAWPAWRASLWRCGDPDFVHRST